MRVPLLLDHIVGAQEQIRRDGNLLRVRGLAVDDELELGRLLDRQGGGLGALQDLVDVARRAVVEVGIKHAVGKQPARLYEVTRGVDRRRAVLGCEVDEQRLVCLRERLDAEDEAIDARFYCRVERGGELIRLAHVDHVRLEVERRCGAFEHLPTGERRRIVGIHDAADPLHAGGDRLEELDTLRTDLGHLSREPRHAVDRIGNRRGNHRDPAFRIARGERGRRAAGQENIDLLSREVGGQRREAVGVSLGRAIEHDVAAAFLVAEVLQALVQLGEIGVVGRDRQGLEHADPVDPLLLGGERRATERQGACQEGAARGHEAPILRRIPRGHNLLSRTRVAAPAQNRGKCCPFSRFLISVPVAKAFPKSIDDTQKLLASGEYVADRSLATTLFLSLSMRRPLFLEGEAGVGKTEIAKVVSQALGRDLIRLQCYEGLDISQAAYEWNYSRQMIEIRLAEAAGEKDKAKLGSQIYSDEFLVKRPLARALEASEEGGAPVLLIDELDRTDEPFEAYLLEVLSDWQITIPEIGTLKAKEPPIVVITSNRTREIHDAVKRRCFYHWVDYPDAQRELEILRRKAPKAAAALSKEVVAFVQRLRKTELYKLPGVAETIDWTNCLAALDRVTLDPETVNNTLGVLLKYRDDLERVAGDEVERLVNEAKAAAAA